MSRKRKLNQFENSAWLNNMTFAQYVDRLTEISISMFEWEGLPDTVDPRYMELQLFLNGSAIYFTDEVLGELCLSNSSTGSFNVYGEPDRRRAYSRYNNYQKWLTKDDSVIIWNNYMRTNSTLDIEMFAYRLYNCDRIVDVNLNAQKTPILVTSTEQQRLTMINLYKEYDGNQPFILGDKFADLNSLKVLKTDAPFIADKVQEAKSKIWNEFLTYIGIPNVNYQKQERLISDEVNRSQGGTLAGLHSRLGMRELAAAKINKMFNHNIKVKLSDTIVDLAKFHDNRGNVDTDPNDFEGEYEYE